MKILIASAVYYPMINGVATFAHNLAIGLAKKGHEVYVVCPSFVGRKHVEKKDGVTVFYLRSMRIPFYPDQINDVPKKQYLYRRGMWVCPAPIREIRKIIKKVNPDVIHSQSCDTIGAVMLHYAKVNKIPIVTTEHNYPDVFTAQITNIKAIKKILDKILSSYLVNFQKKSNYVTMPTQIAIEDFIANSRKEFEIPVEALSNGVDLKNFYPKRAKRQIYDKYDLPTDRLIVLYVGRVDPEKSIGTVVEAFSRVLEDIPDALLVVVGDGTDKSRLKKLAKYLGIEKNVKFLGRILPPDLMEIYRTGDVFVTASEIETQGIVLVEAAASGLPLVAVDKGAVREICHTGENGFLCKPGGDIDGIAEGVKKLLLDEEFRRKMSDGSIEIAKKHDIRNTLTRFEEIYSEAISRK